jgi:HEAT repeat protein
MFTVASLPAIAQSDNFSKQECVYENLIAGINSDNLGLKTSAAYFLGEYKCEKALYPLMHMLKCENREDVRIVAALALIKIGRAKGVFAVKRAIRFDDSERVRKLCSNFYNAYMEKEVVLEQFARK